MLYIMRKSSATLISPLSGTEMGARKCDIVLLSASDLIESRFLLRGQSQSRERSVGPI